MNQRTKFMTLFIIGIVLAVLAAVFMVVDVLPLAARITILIVGIALIATSSPISKGLRR